MLKSSPYVFCYWEIEPGQWAQKLATKDFVLFPIQWAQGIEDLLEVSSLAQEQGVSFVWLWPTSATPLLPCGGGIETEPVMEDQNGEILFYREGEFIKKIHSWHGIKTYQQFLKSIQSLEECYSSFSYLKGIYTFESSIEKEGKYYSLNEDFSSFAQENSRRKGLSLKEYTQNLNHLYLELVKESFKKSYLGHRKIHFNIDLQNSFLNIFDLEKDILKEFYFHEFAQESLQLLEPIPNSPLSPLQIQMEEGGENKILQLTKKIGLVEVLREQYSFQYIYSEKAIEDNNELSFYLQGELDTYLLSNILKKFLMGKSYVLSSEVFTPETKKQFDRFLKENNLLAESILFHTTTFYTSCSRGQLVVFDHEGLINCDKNEQKDFWAKMIKSLASELPITQGSLDQSIGYFFNQTWEKWNFTSGRELKLISREGESIQFEAKLPKNWTFLGGHPSSEVQFNQGNLRVYSKRSSLKLQFGLIEEKAS